MLKRVGSVRAVYESELEARGYASDPAQLRGIEALERCAAEWAQYKEQRSNAFKKLINRPPIPRGVYMHGGVGRGKSFLMDCFFQAVPVVRKTRLHFHEFMRSVHRELDELKGVADPLDEVARRIAKRYRTSVKTLMRLNGLRKSVIYPGQVIVVRGRR